MGGEVLAVIIETTLPCICFKIIKQPKLNTESRNFSVSHFLSWGCTLLCRGGGSNRADFVGFPRACQGAREAVQGGSREGVMAGSPRPLNRSLPLPVSGFLGRSGGGNGRQQMAGQSRARFAVLPSLVVGRCAIIPP